MPIYHPTRTYDRAQGPSHVFWFPPKPPVATPSFTATLFPAGGGAVATDDFNRANAGNLGANWTNSSGSSVALTLTSNQTANGASGGVCLEAYTAVAAPNDQYSKCTLKGLQATSDEGPGPAARMSTSALTGYFAQCNTTEIKLYKVVTASYTQLGSDAAAAAVNDIIEIDAVGTSITVKKNGSTIIGPITDSAIASGNWGLWSGGGGATNVLNVDNWEGGTPGAGAAVATLSRRTGKALSATFSPVVALAKKIIDSGFVAALSFVGAIAKNLRKTLTAALTWIGNLATTFIAAGGTTFTKGLTATLSFVGAATKNTRKTFSATLFQGDFATSFPATENPISQGGRWINGLATGLDWYDVATTTGKAFGTQTGGSALYTDSTAILTGSWPADQTVQATVYVSATNTTTFQEVEIRLRSTMTAHSSTGYEVLWSVNPSDLYCQIVRWNGALGGFTLLDSRTGNAVGNGDTVKATVVGNVISCYINNGFIFSATDSTYSSGNPGLGFYLQFSSLPTATASDYGFSSFTVLGGGGVVAALTRRAGKALAATKSFTGAITKRIVDSGFTATLSFIGATAKRIADAGFAATTSFAGFLASSKSFLKSLTATLSFVGGFTKFSQKVFTPALSFIAALTRSTSHLLTATLSFVGGLLKAIRDAGFAATLSSTGLLAASKSFLKALSATLSFVGSMSAKIIATRAFTATLSFAATSSRRVNKALSATLSSASALLRRIPQNLSATLSFVGSTTRRLFDAGFTATLSFIGNLATFFSHGGTAFTQSLTATLSFVGSMSARIIATRAFSATLSATASLSRWTLKGFSATLSAAASLVKRITRTFTGTLSSAGATLKAIRDAGFSAALSFSGNLVGIAVHFFTRSFTATVSFVGNLTSRRTFAKLFSATMAFTGVIRRQTSKTLAATVSFSSALQRVIRKVFNATKSLAGFLFRGGAVTLIAGIITGALVKMGLAGSSVKTPKTGSRLRIERTK